MSPAEYLDAAKARLELKSDYSLAKKAGINKCWIPGIRKGNRAIPIQTAYWLAITLEKDPAEVVADLEMQREKNPERLKFWSGFLSRAALLLGLVVVLPSLLSGPTGNAHAANGGTGATPHNPYYVK